MPALSEEARLEESRRLRLAKRAKDAFMIVDSNHDGMVTREELKKLFIKLDPLRYDEARLEDFFVSADIDHDGVIKIDDFLAWVFDCREAMLAVEVALMPEAVEAFACVPDVAQPGITQAGEAIPSINCKNSASISVSAITMSGEVIFNAFALSPDDHIKVLRKAAQASATTKCQPGYQYRILLEHEALDDDLLVKDTALVSGSTVTAIAVVYPEIVKMMEHFKELVGFLKNGNDLHYVDGPSYFDLGPAEEALKELNRYGWVGKWQFKKIRNLLDWRGKQVNAPSGVTRAEWRCKEPGKCIAQSATQYFIDILDSLNKESTAVEYTSTSNLRCLVIWALGGIGPDAIRALPHLMTALMENKAMVRREAMKSILWLTRQCPQQMAPVIVDLLSHEDTELVRFALVQGVGGFDRWDIPNHGVMAAPLENCSEVMNMAVPKLLNMADNHPHRWIKRAAGKTLKKLGFCGQLSSYLKRDLMNDELWNEAKVRFEERLERALLDNQVAEEKMRQSIDSRIKNLEDKAQLLSTIFEHSRSCGNAVAFPVRDGFDVNSLRDSIDREAPWEFGIDGEVAWNCLPADVIFGTQVSVTGDPRIGRDLGGRRRQLKRHFMKPRETYTHNTLRSEYSQRFAEHFFRKLEVIEGGDPFHMWMFPNRTSPPAEFDPFYTGPYGVQEKYEFDAHEEDYDYDEEEDGSDKNNDEGWSKAYSRLYPEFYSEGDDYDEEE